MVLRVGDVMTRGVIYVKPSETIQEVARIMERNDIDSVIIMDKRRGVGIITDADIISKVVAKGKDPKRVKVSEVMSHPLITISPDVDLDTAVRRMIEQNIRRLVVTEDGTDQSRIIGIISEFDVVKAEPGMMTLIAEKSKWDIADLTSPLGTISGICESCDNYSEDLRILNGRLLCEDCASEEE